MLSVSVHKMFCNDLSGDHSLFVTCGRRGWEDFGTFRQWRVGGGKESVVAHRV